MTKTKTLIKEMLQENTGTHFLDSGGAYGRHWQENQKIDDWDNLPEVDFEIENDGSISYTISVYHYLIKQTKDELDSICQKFNRLQDNDKNDDWVKNDNFLTDLYGVTVDGWNYLKPLLIDNNNNNMEWTNTYNYDSYLSQVLQYTTIIINNKDYVLLQIHNGCDVRGGYTTAKLLPLVDVDLFGREEIYGIVNGKLVSNTYDGYSLRYDYDNFDYKPLEWLIDKPVYCNPEVKDHKIELFLSGF